MISNSQSFYSVILEDMISSKNESVIIHDLSDLTLQIIFDSSQVSGNVGLKSWNACNNSSHGPLWCIDFQCGIEEISSHFIVCIVYHQVLRHRSEHVTSSLAKQYMAKPLIARLNGLIEFEVSELTSRTVDDTALGILMRQHSPGIAIVSSER